MQSLPQLRSEEYEIMRELSLQMGEFTDEQISRWDDLRAKIKAKTQSYISVVSKGGLIDQDIQKVKDYISDAKAYIEKLEEQKEFMERVLNEIAVQKGFIEFENGAKMYVKPYFKKHREINMELVPDVLGSFTLPKLSADEYWGIMDVLNANIEDSPNPLYSKLKNQSKHTANLSDLPEDHSAVKTHLIPSIKIVKNRPKEEINGQQND